MKNSYIELRLGPRKCGKSEFVENEVRNSVRKLYVGTLPTNNTFKKTITSHKNRRKNFMWDEYETQFHLEKDLIEIENKIINYTFNDVCLIDGLTTWFIMLEKNLINHSFIEKSAIDFSIKLSNMIKRHLITWRLIDVYPNDGYSLITCIIQNTLINEIKKLNCIYHV